MRTSSATSLVIHCDTNNQVNQTNPTLEGLNNRDPGVSLQVFATKANRHKECFVVKVVGSKEVGEELRY